MAGVDEIRLGGWNKLTVFFLGQADSTNRAGMNDALAPRPARRLQHLVRARDIGLVHRSIIAHPKVVTCRHMETPITTLEFTFQQIAVENIASHPLIFCAGQTARIGARSQQRFDAMSARAEFVDQVRSDEAGGSGDKTFHAE